MGQLHAAHRGAIDMADTTAPRESGFKTNPDYRITFERSPRRARQVQGAMIADSTECICCSRRGICRSIIFRAAMSAWIC